MRDMNPSNPNNWKLVCSACGTEWASGETIDLAEGHFKEEHPDLENPHFNTIWVGVGPSPKPGKHKTRKRRRR